MLRQVTNAALPMRCPYSGPGVRWREVSMAFVVPSDKDLTYEDLCDGKVASYKMPKGAKFIADQKLLRAHSGKIERHELEAGVIAQLNDKQIKAP